jgi:hypothetical protein
MRNTIKALAPLVLAGQLLAGGFYLQLGNPEASQEAQKAGAVLTVKATGCHDPATATLTATAIGVVNGERREIPLKVSHLTGDGFFAIAQQWPREGKWVISLVARNGEQFTNTLVSAGPSGVDRTRFKEGMHQFTATDVEAMLK